MIAQGLMMGISKRELLETYYPDELPAVIEAWADMHGLNRDADAQPVSVTAFLSM